MPKSALFLSPLQATAFYSSGYGHLSYAINNFRRSLNRTLLYLSLERGLLHTVMCLKFSLSPVMWIWIYPFLSFSAHIPKAATMAFLPLNTLTSPGFIFILLSIFRFGTYHPETLCNLFPFDTSPFLLKLVSQDILNFRVLLN